MCSCFQSKLVPARVSDHNGVVIVEKSSINLLQNKASPRKLVSSETVCGGLASFNAFILSSVSAIPDAENLKPKYVSSL